MRRMPLSRISTIHQEGLVPEEEEDYEGYEETSFWHYGSACSIGAISDDDGYAEYLTSWGEWKPYLTPSQMNKITNIKVRWYNK